MKEEVREPTGQAEEELALRRLGRCEARNGWWWGGRSSVVLREERGPVSTVLLSHQGSLTESQNPKGWKRPPRIIIRSKHQSISIMPINTINRII